MCAAGDGRFGNVPVQGRQRPLLQGGRVRRNGVEGIRQHRLKPYAENRLHRVLPSRCDPYRLCKPGSHRDPPGFEPFERHARSGSERFLLQRFEGRDATAIFPKHFTDIIERPGGRLDGFPQFPYRRMCSRLARLGPVQFLLHRLDAKPKRLCTTLQRIRVKRTALVLQRTRP